MAKKAMKIKESHHPESVNKECASCETEMNAEELSKVSDDESACVYFV